MKNFRGLIAYIYGMKRAGIESLYEHQTLGVRILKHLLFWLFFVFYNVTTWGAYNEEISQSIFSEFCYLPAKVLMTYLTIYYLFPRFLLPKQYLKFTLWFLAGLVFFGLINRLITYYVIYPYYFPEAVGSGFWRIKVFFEITIIVNVVSLPAAFKLFQYWYSNEKSRKQLHREKIEAELKLLKSQIHPHFLFNTLNNLYALSLENSSQTPELLLKLSSLLNYMLYECNMPLVPLEKEIKYIHDYISLEKIRYGDKLELSCETSGNIQEHSIAPLILLPFIENSFKHGASQHTNKPWINLNIWVDESLLHLQIENSIEEEPVKEEASYMQGIGLKNVNRRLDLLYKDRYELIVRREDSFFVYLKLHLTPSSP